MDEVRNAWPLAFRPSGSLADLQRLLWGLRRARELASATLERSGLWIFGGAVLMRGPARGRWGPTPRPSTATPRANNIPYDGMTFIPPFFPPLDTYAKKKTLSTSHWPVTADLSPRTRYEIKTASIYQSILIQKHDVTHANCFTVIIALNSP